MPMCFNCERIILNLRLSILDALSKGRMGFAVQRVSFKMKVIE